MGRTNRAAASGPRSPDGAKNRDQELAEPSSSKTSPGLRAVRTVSDFHIRTRTKSDGDSQGKASGRGAQEEESPPGSPPGSAQRKLKKTEGTPLRSDARPQTFPAAQVVRKSTLADDPDLQDTLGEGVVTAASHRS